ncbi:MAG: RsmB/NOP family class I SAM-dependent RNA methyltransferase [Desulfurococcales archaeon]|nr:RsmB/NOP family class I SAM-dependent RNA methyltransferase [Desulfurococcales archaeon]
MRGGRRHRRGCPRLGGEGLCGTRLHYDAGLAERLEPILGGPGGLCRELAALEAPPPRLYVRVNTLRVDPREYLDRLRSAGLPFHADPDIPEALWSPVEGPLPVPLRPLRVVADKRAAESVLMGSDLYAPGVLWAPRTLRRGDDVTIVAENGVPVASGVAEMGYEELRRSRRGLAVRVTHPRFRAPRVRGLPGYGEGLIYGQSLPSIAAVRYLDPQPGWVIVDLTAAPGGKVSHAAQLAGPRSRVIAVDRPSKEALLRGTLERLGLGWVEVVAGDSRRLPGPLAALAGRADAVIVDPPCTNLGVRPKVYDRRSLGDSIAAARYQRGFIAAASRLLRPGGRMLYSVCTLTWDEGPANALRAIREHGLEPVEPPRWLASRAEPLDVGVLFRPAAHGTPGFYIAVLRKRGVTL